ncbi:hypothetical protein GCM10017600_80000 [Streptosporangium carneum]|uniref:Uncharacterized protein n=1 Tax=Streptosporangium carneum TaxID=47481 RepID=A0A9W6IBD5_9ACTN|nr:hypothetical protein GCM10017600_80000 [Streptosporangium carneum]
MARKDSPSACTARPPRAAAILRATVLAALAVLEDVKGVADMAVTNRVARRPAGRRGIL